MNRQEKEKEKRQERLRLFVNKNQWVKKKSMEQTLEDMSAQLLEYRRDLQHIRMQEAVTEAKIDELAKKVHQLESILRDKTNISTDTDNDSIGSTDALPTLSLITDEHSSAYGIDGKMDEDYPTFTINMYA